MWRYIPAPGAEAEAQSPEAVSNAVATATAAISAAETNVLYQDLYERYVRVFYDRTSGSASLDVAISLKSA